MNCRLSQRKQILTVVSSHVRLVATTLITWYLKQFHETYQDYPRKTRSDMHVRRGVSFNNNLKISSKKRRALSGMWTFINKGCQFRKGGSEREEKKINLLSSYFSAILLNAHTHPLSSNIKDMCVARLLLSLSHFPLLSLWLTCPERERGKALYFWKKSYVQQTLSKNK